MLSNTSFRSMHRFRNQNADSSRVNSARSIGYYAPREEREEQIRALRTASFNLGFDKPNYVTAQQEKSMAELGAVCKTPITNEVDIQAQNRSRMNSARSVLSEYNAGCASAQNLHEAYAKLRARQWSLAHARADDKSPDAKTINRRFYDQKDKGGGAYNRDRATWQEQAAYLKASHINMSVRQFDQTFTTTNREQEKAKVMVMESSRNQLNQDSSQGSIRSLGASNNLGSAASLKKSSICLGSDKKYFNYKEARTAFQDGFGLPMPIRGCSQLASIKEKDLERNESGQTLEYNKANIGKGKSEYGKNDDDCLSISSNDYASLGLGGKLSLTMNNFKFSYNDNKAEQNRFNDAKRRDQMQPNFDSIMGRLGQPRPKSTLDNIMQSKGSSRDHSARGAAHARTFDIFAGGRSTGPRDLDYKSMQKVTQMTNQAQTNPDYAKNHNAYVLMKERSHNRSFTYDNEADAQTPVKSKANDLLKDEKLATRLGLTEQMEKYINHDLGLIQEEQEHTKQHTKRAKRAQNIDLATQKSKLVGTSTTYKDANYHKTVQNADMQRQYTKLRDYDRQSSIQRASISQSEQQKMQLKALKRAGKDEMLHLKELERQRQEQIVQQYLSEQKQNFSKSNLAKAYGAQGQANHKEKLAIVAKGRSQNFDIAKQTHQGAILAPILGYGQAQGVSINKPIRQSINGDKSLTLLQSRLPPPILAASRHMAPSIMSSNKRSIAHSPPTFFNNGQVYRMPNINSHLQNITPVMAKKSFRGSNQPVERTVSEMKKPRQAELGSVTAFDGQHTRPASMLEQQQKKEDAPHGYMQVRRGSTMGKNSPNERYASLKSVLDDARNSSIPTIQTRQQIDPYEWRQPRLLKQAFENLKERDQAIEPPQGSLAQIHKIYTDTKLLKRIFKKEAEGQASLAKEAPFIYQAAARANSIVTATPREEQRIAHQKRRQSEATYKTSNQSFMRWIQPMPRPKNA